MSLFKINSDQHKLFFIDVLYTYKYKLQKTNYKGREKNSKQRVKEKIIENNVF